MPTFDITYIVTDYRIVSARFTMEVEAAGEEEARAIVFGDPQNGDYVELVSDEPLPQGELVEVPEDAVEIESVTNQTI